MPCGGGGELTPSPFSRPTFCTDFDSYATLYELLVTVKTSSWEADFLCDVNEFDFVLQSPLRPPHEMVSLKNNFLFYFFNP